jgi:NAD(P)-dependent dehydrogenase (short-subunit alcohol dehydrogenase family)
MKLQGKAAFVSGAARGIGLAVARAFAAEGAAVALADLNAGEAEAQAGTLAAAGAKTIGLACDVADSASVKAAVDAAAAAFGRLDILSCNAAVMTPAHSLADLPEAEWHRAIAVNLTGSYLVCRHGIPHLKAAGGGSVILTASQMGKVAWPGSAVYCTTKGALIQLAKGIALDHVGDGIRCNTLSPGGTATDRMVAKFGDLETAEREWGPKHAMGRLGRVEEIARGAVFLASADSSFMTGADLVLDGGYTAW